MGCVCVCTHACVRVCVCMCKFRGHRAKEKTCSMCKCRSCFVCNPDQLSLFCLCGVSKLKSSPPECYI